jgi:hypothetical protein
MESTISQLLPEFETRKQVYVRRYELIRVLKAGDPAARELAHKLAKCAGGEPCGSSTCPVCVWRLRKSFVVGVNNCVKKLRLVQQCPITAFSAISSADKHRVEKLYRADLSLINKRVQRQCQRAGLPLVFGGVDISLNEDSPRKKLPFWQLHVYGVVVGQDREAVKRALKHLYGRDGSNPRPFRSRECTNLPKALSYAIKPMFVRRVSYIDHRGSRNTHDVSLKRSQLRELATWLGQYPLSDRCFLTGCRRYGDRIELNPGVKEKIYKEIIE